ncbi:hypothetical protein JANAI62_00980 [Jannaschia pagri]|uniref:Uncharacterized protein n=1 Tax=Jannaschia pagri TaxID=2829797 RepID=A0ABQ4NGC1_9RHOB|nr:MULTISPECIES: hypothetical protein [unclassified Jannaschia]GIT90420.1 hypothetical protein JANAI61_08780 [Jannaschia sp. AI_61]GIT93475.1 hypothetical protein JANAI62_00980 [Jannaschia sp. AI_62]
MTKYTILACALAAPLAITPALADKKWPDCYCTDSSGSRVEIGQTTCLTVNGRAFQAKCEMSLNVPIWRNNGQGCVTG